MFAFIKATQQTFKQSYFIFEMSMTGAIPLKCVFIVVWEIKVIGPYEHTILFLIIFDNG